jgi:N-acetyl-anhydromuramyl-L-alanine amidase AmpD
VKQKNILGFGSVGIAVVELQRRLSHLGYAVNISGFFDEKTEEAVADFQKKSFCSGALDQKTWDNISEDFDKKLQAASKTEQEENQGTSVEDPETGGLVHTGPLKQIPYLPDNAFSRRGWVPDTIVIGYTGTVGANHTIALLNLRGVLSAHFVVQEEEINIVTPVDLSCSLGDVDKGTNLSTLPYRSIVILVENMGPLKKAKVGFSHAAFETEEWRSDIYGPPMQTKEKEQWQYEYWANFPFNQMDALKALCLDLINQFPIASIVGFHELSTVQNSPGPAFPLSDFKSLLKSKDE